MTKLVFIDLDGTLINPPSTEQSLLQYLFLHGYLRLTQFINTGWFVLRWMLRYGKFVFIKDKAYLTALSAKKIGQVGAKLARDKLLARIRPKMRELILQHAKAGDINILLTGSHEFIGKIFAEHLNIPELSATQCVVKNGKFCNAPLLSHPFAEDKLRIAKEFCAKYNISLENSVAYGNSINDRFLLSAVGEPVAVTPDRKLRRLARKLGWKIVC